MKDKLVHVVWMDAEVNNEWTDEKDLHNHTNLYCETIGFMVKNATAKKPVYIIASTRSKDAFGKYEYNAITKIPKTWVQKIEKLEKEENE